MNCTIWNLYALSKNFGTTPHTAYTLKIQPDIGKQTNDSYEYTVKSIVKYIFVCFINVNVICYQLTLQRILI